MTTIIPAALAKEISKLLEDRGVPASRRARVLAALQAGERSSNPRRPSWSAAVTVAEFERIGFPVNDDLARRIEQAVGGGA